MNDAVSDGIWINLDGKRFDSTQHWWMRESVENRVYNETRLFDKLQYRKSIIE